MTVWPGIVIRAGSAPKKAGVTDTASPHIVNCKATW